MAQIYSIYGGMKPISVDDKNNLEIGRVLRMNGYNNPEHIIYKNLGVDSKFPGYGATYEWVNPETLTIGRSQAFSLEWIENKKDNRIQTYITHDFIPAQIVNELYAKSVAAEKERKEAAAKIPPTVYVNLNDTAKIIRNELKSAYPGIKFSVRGKSYSGGSSIRVSWENGPTTKTVQEIVGKFAGSTYDGMQDLKEYVDTEYQGKLTHFQTDHVFTDRSISNFDEKLELAMNFIRETCNVEITERGEFFTGRHIAELARQILYHQDYMTGETLLDVFDKYPRLWN